MQGPRKSQLMYRQTWILWTGSQSPFWAPFSATSHLNFWVWVDPVHGKRRLHLVLLGRVIEALLVAALLKDSIRDGANAEPQPHAPIAREGFLIKS